MHGHPIIAVADRRRKEQKGGALRHTPGGVYRECALTRVACLVSW